MKLQLLSINCQTISEDKQMSEQSKVRPTYQRNDFKINLHLNQKINTEIDYLLEDWKVRPTGWQMQKQQR